MHCHALQWFFAQFGVGKNNGGCVSLQTKRAQQVSCLSIIVVHLVLYSEIHKCTWKITSLERSPDQECSRSIRGALQAGFFTIVQGKVVFLFSLSWSYLKDQLRPWERERDREREGERERERERQKNDFARESDWYSDVDRSRSYILPGNSLT